MVGIIKQLCGQWSKMTSRKTFSWDKIASTFRSAAAIIFISECLVWYEAEAIIKWFSFFIFEWSKNQTKPLSEALRLWTQTVKLVAETFTWWDGGMAGWWGDLWFRGERCCDCGGTWEPSHECVTTGAACIVLNNEISAGVSSYSSSSTNCFINFRLRFLS